MPPKSKEPKKRAMSRSRKLTGNSSDVEDHGDFNPAKRSNTPCPPNLPRSTESGAFPYTNNEVETEDDDDPRSISSYASEECGSGGVSIHSVMTLGALYRTLCGILGKSFGDVLVEDGASRVALYNALLHDVFGGISVARPRSKPAQLHAAYFGRAISIVVCKADKLDLKCEKAFESAPILSVPRDHETRADKPIKDRMKLILSAEDWPEHLISLLVCLDDFLTVFCSNLVKGSLYAGSGLSVPTKAQLSRRWEKGDKPGDAPMRHLVSSYLSKDAEGKETDTLNYTLDFSITSRDRTIAATLCDGGLFPTAPATTPGLLGRGDRVFPSLLIRGLNLLPLYQRIGPNVLSTALWCKKRAAAVDVDAMDYSDAVSF